MSQEQTPPTQNVVASTLLVEEQSSRLFRDRMMSATAAMLLMVLLAVIFRALGGVLKPFFIALFLSYLVFPAVEYLHRRGLPKPVGFGLTMSGLIVVFLGVLQLLFTNVQSFFKQIGKYGPKIEQWENQLTSLAHRFKFLPESETLSLSDVFALIPQDFIAKAVGGGTTALLGILGNLVVVLVVMVFIMLEVERIPERIEKAYETRSKFILQIFDDINTNIQRYILIKVIFSALTALFSILFMALFGLDFFLLFGAIIFVFNFIPYVGSWAATILPFLVALLQFSEPWPALWILGLIALVQLVLGSILEPRFHGRNLNLSPLLILVALAVWGWLWGVVGMVLAIPIMVSIRITLEQVKATRPISILMSNVTKDDTAELAHQQKLSERDEDMAREISTSIISTSGILSPSDSGIIPPGAVSKPER